MPKNKEDGDRKRKSDLDILIGIVQKNYTTYNDARHDASILEQRSIGAMSALEKMLEELVKMKEYKKP